MDEPLPSDESNQQGGNRLVPRGPGPSQDRKIAKSQNLPSRDMFGGPLVGVAVFVVIAILLGWGLISLMNGMLEQTRQDLSAIGVQHGFTTREVYEIQKPLLLGYAADGRLLLYPERGDLPSTAPGRRRAATVQGFFEHQAKLDAGEPGDMQYQDVLGIVDTGTMLRIEQVIQDVDNRQTRLLLRCVILNGAFEGKEVTALHLEHEVADQDTGQKQYEPRPELLKSLPPLQGTERLQSAPQEPEETEPDPAAPPPPDAP